MCLLLKYKGGIFVLQFLMDYGIINSAINLLLFVKPFS